MFKLFNKDLKLFFTDKRSVVLTFILPIILISLFAFAFGGIGKSKGQTKPIELLVCDMDNRSSSQDIIHKLDSLKGLKIVNKNILEAKDLVIKGKYPGALVFYKGFQDSIEQGKDKPIELLYDWAREMEIGMLQPVLISSIMSSIGKKTVTNNIEKYLHKNFPNIDKSISDRILGDVTQEGNKKDSMSPSFDFKSSLKMTSVVGERKEANLGLIQAVAGTSIMMLLFSVAGMGTGILEEKENGTIKRLLFSPLKGSTILYGKMLFTLFISVIQLMLMFLFASVAFGLDLTINIPALTFLIIATAFAISSFGTFLAAISKTRQQAQSLGTLVILIMSAIGGSMIPLFIMPGIMKKIAIFSVNYWGIQGFYDIFWRMLPLTDILPRILVLLGIGTVMTIISIRLFRKNLLKIV